ncbi:hypothetical protein WICPIJ_008306 [Wickerhamomyces pijperi]|uniref:Uncharacterized protein n=1 Tax=Wickerhamomyces pijperi TaxID=599730 RepID=A0A9P8PXX8_WICPI|nr:hypothetical protein WICPIJ_008306 [Wickerhamomyces pijperi]
MDFFKVFSILFPTYYILQCLLPTALSVLNLSELTNSQHKTMTEGLNISKIPVKFNLEWRGYPSRLMTSDSNNHTKFIETANPRYAFPESGHNWYNVSTLWLEDHITKNKLEFLGCMYDTNLSFSEKEKVTSLVSSEAVIKFCAQ